MVLSSKGGKIKVAHLTSVHPRYDTRIFIKMCSSLSSSGYNVTLVVADGLGDEKKNGVKIIDVGKTLGGRLSRMTKTTDNIFKQAKKLDADIYHLHDPELMPIGIKLKKCGKKVIFDAHEDYPKQIKAKTYLNKYVKIILSTVLKLYEKWACKKFDAIITATPYIREKFLKINPNSVDINNFPIVNELVNTTQWQKKQNEVCYIGAIAKIRGIQEMVSAMAYAKDTRLNLGGKFTEKLIEEAVKSDTAWNKVNELGYLNREEIANVLAKSKVGLVILHPVINYIDALPVKMFEYMASGIPVIASDFPLWKEIVEGSECGLCVNPLEPKKIGETISFLMENPLKAEQMGKNGQKAVKEKYNWSIEERKLFDLYAQLSQS